MTTRMLIDARHAEETRVAVVKGNRIEEFDFEAAARKQIKGNIYLAKVTRVEPSLQAAFIEYGGNRHGFLAFSEIHPDYYQIPREDREALLREEQRLAESGHPDDDEHDDARADDADDDADEAGHDDGPDGDADGEGGEEEANGRPPAPKPEEHGGADDAGADALRRRRMLLRRRYKIQDVIRRRQVMLVQVVKEERGNKGAALTTYISLAGRYSVLMPNTASGGGISRKIQSVADRKRLKSLIADLNLPSSMGAIVRTAGLERTKTEIRRDFDYLTRLWDGIREKTLQSAAPALIHEDSDLIKRAIRDIYSKDIDEVLVDGEAGYRQARGFMKLLMPGHVRRLKLYADPVPLFHRAGVEGQLAAMMNPVVQLRSGGYIVINPTEALVSIDVNSGRSTREHNIEETAYKTNLEAADEIARQLRLRDMAGLIVIDFIDMESSGNDRRVERALKDALKDDRARIQVGRISAFGLMEMSRQRLRTGVLEASTHSCPMCDGTGLIRSPSSAGLLALRMLEEEAVKGRCTQFRLRADRAVAVYVLNRKRAEISELEERYGVLIEVVPDESLIGSRMAVDCSGPPPAQPPRAATLPTIIEEDDDDLPEVDEAEEADEEAAERTDERGDGDDARGRRDERPREEGDERGRGRRRRRRGGRGREEQREPLATDADADAGADEADQPAEAGQAAEPRDEGEVAEREGRRRRRRRRGGRRDDGATPQADRTDAGQADGERTDSGLTAGEPEAGDAEGADDAMVDVPVATVEPIAVASDAVAAEPAMADAAGDAAAGPAPRKRRAPSRRRKADTDAVDAADANAAPAPMPDAATPEAPAPEAAGDAEPAAPAEKPKRSRARKPKVEAAPAEAATADAALDVTPVDVAAVPVAPAGTPDADADVDAEADTNASSGDDASAAPEAGAADADPAAPPRRGWWQRTFGA